MVPGGKIWEVSEVPGRTYYVGNAVLSEYQLQPAPPEPEPLAPLAERLDAVLILRTQMGAETREKVVKDIMGELEKSE
jgi:hypothetical protein